MSVDEKQVEKLTKAINNSFRKQIQKDKQLKNAFLLVHSEKRNIHVHVTEGLLNTKQPTYMASAGKIFTSVLIGMLFEEGKISYDDPITKFLEDQVAKRLHLYNGKDYTDQITIRHLLTHTSGLYDHFRPLWKRMLEDGDFNLTPKDAIIWTKTNQRGSFIPGDNFKYTNTNYHLLGLIIERLTNMPYHEALTNYIFKRADMLNSSMLHTSKPLHKNTPYVADFYINKKNITSYKGLAGFAYASGGVVSTGDDLLKFMKALTFEQLIKKETFQDMINQKVTYGIGKDYGYGIMQFRPVPFLMPKIYQMWGHTGSTGAVMFYHPAFDTYFIGNFNDFSYEKKGVRFILRKVVRELAKEIGDKINK